jgi:hypothetical protein
MLRKCASMVRGLRNSLAAASFGGGAGGDDAGDLEFLRGELSGTGWPLQRPPLPLETSLPGVFAAGDVRHGSVKRVASAVGEGPIAGTQVAQYLQDQRHAR